MGSIRVGAVLGILFLAVFPSVVFSLGLGEITANSYINQQLKAEIKLISLGKNEIDSIKVGLADAVAFEKADLDRPYILSKLRFKVVPGRDGAPIIQVSTQDSVREPYLDFLLKIKWGDSTLMRQYTLLLDPMPTPVQTARLSQHATATSPATQPSLMAGSESYGPVKSSETLWVIADRLRSSSAVGIKQMMMALQRANPDAFQHDNVNFLKQGVTLEIPDEADVLSISSKQAHREFMAQTQAWKEIRANRRHASTAPSAPKVPIAPVVQETAPVASVPEVSEPEPAAAETPPPDAMFDEAGEKNLAVLPMSEFEKGWGVSENAEGEYPEGSTDKTREAMADSEQSLQAVEAINKDLEDLKSVLETKIDALHQALEEKDRAIDDLKRNLEKRELEVVTAPVSAPEPIQPAVVETPISTSMDPLLSTTKDMVANWRSNLWIPLSVLSGVLALVIIIILIRQRRIYSQDLSQATASYDADVEHEMPNIPDALEQKSSDDGALPEELEIAKISGSAVGMDVDTILTETDIYLAYRRYGQAEALVLDGIHVHPEDQLLKAKLMEIYAYRGEKDLFVETMETTYSMVAANPEVWSRVVELGQRLVPDHPLFNRQDAVPNGQAEEKSLNTPAPVDSKDNGVEPGDDLDLKDLFLDEDAPEAGQQDIELDIDLVNHLPTYDRPKD
ncbi:MAG: hypothetical protein GY696_11020 [Gammaproteobacteria bacterium]|nr:hypothetical protein [Gammaproteobacteria bacterium]